MPALKLLVVTQGVLLSLAKTSAGSAKWTDYANYEKYVKADAQSPADYSQYMEYLQYLKTYNGTGVKAAGKYTKYADYKTFVESEGKTPMDYKSYMDFQEYVKGHSDFQKYSDYSKYTDRTSAKIGGAQLTDYVAFLQSRANPSQDTYEDYKSYLENQGKPVLSEEKYNSLQRSMGDFNKYLEYHHYVEKNSQGPIDYQQYMSYMKYLQSYNSQGKEDAGSYAHYLDYDKYVQGQGSQAMDYKQYMEFHKYLGTISGSSAGADSSYSQYLPKSEDWRSASLSPGVAGFVAVPEGSETAPAAAAGSETGDYSKYMKEYAQGDYTKYMSGQGGGDYQQYMQGYQQYLNGGSDYQKYMKGYQHFSQGHGAGDYQSYVQGKGQGAGGGNFQDYISKYAPGFKQFADYQKYTNMKSDYLNGNWTAAWKDQTFLKNTENQQSAPMDPADCQTVAELKAWRAARLRLTNSFVPAVAQQQVVKQIDSDYKKNLARLRLEVVGPKTRQHLPVRKEVAHGDEGEGTVTLSPKERAELPPPFKPSSQRLAERETKDDTEESSDSRASTPERSTQEHPKLNREEEQELPKLTQSARSDALAEKATKNATAQTQTEIALMAEEDTSAFQPSTLFVLLAVATGLAIPAFVTLLGRLVFRPTQTEGSFIALADTV